jgi:hypothetical protein
MRNLLIAGAMLMFIGGGGFVYIAYFAPALGTGPQDDDNLAYVGFVLVAIGLAFIGFILFCIGGLGWLVQSVRSRNRRREGFCAKCGYNLTANTTGICPECGQSVVSTSLKSPK